MKMKKVFMSDGDRDYLLDRLEDILHDNHCLEHKDEICDSLCKYITSNNKELKPFNLETVREGKPVCTRSGKRARIICFDAKGILPIIALVESGDEEKTVRYSNSGRFRFDGMPDEQDLMMLTERKSGWINVYRGQVYNTFEKAEEARKIAEHGGDNCLKTIKIDWEE